MPYTYLVTSHSPASPDAVFAVLLRAATWPQWSPIDSAAVEGDGDPAAPQQVGDVRVFRTGRGAARERIVHLVADRHFRYTNEGGLFRSFRGTVDLIPAPAGGTDITWSAIFEPKLPLSGPFWRWYLTRFMQRMADGLAGYADSAENRPGSGS
ncbi:MxaD family protein [Embleya scabrispora]|uniref:MxaD family protein n=1 Tax=Embleya scabrispora TaxID=159449 RepID=A0A1T3NN30_9ACTN|nr:SRPBCC family protein [Embleya scabrispora]OPC78148.1 MxaD family protein [Embleya scabrispora]